MTDPRPGSEARGDAAEVVADNGECDGAAELARAAELGAGDETPAGPAVAIPDAEPPERFYEGGEVRPG